MIFTVVTSTFNSEKTLERTLDSLLSQTFTDFEYIVIDGDSTDTTVKILESYAPKFEEKGISFRWISEKDNGIYEAWNKGLKLALGEWISFLGSDDYYLQNALEVYHNLISNNDAVWSWESFRRNTTITPAHVGSFHNRQYFKKYGNYDTIFKIAGDYELLLRAKEDLKTLKAEETTAVMSAGGVSNSMIKNVLKETFEAKYKSGSVSLAICYYDYYFSLIKLKVKNILRK